MTAFNKTDLVLKKLHYKRYCLNMKVNLILTAALVTLLGIGTAEAQFMKDRDGKPIMSKEYTDVEGTPYLNSNWGWGSVKLANGNILKDVELKYDLKEDAVYFKDSKSGEPMAFAGPVDEFTLTYTDADDDKKYTRRYKKGFKDVSRTTPASYFEVLSEGTATLLKRLSKDIIITQEFNSASKTKVFKENSKNYYIVKDGKAILVKNDKKSILAVLSDKLPQLETYLKSNKVDFKSDAELGKFVNYYNSL